MRGQQGLKGREPLSIILSITQRRIHVIVDILKGHKSNSNQIKHHKRQRNDTENNNRNKNNGRAEKWVGPIILTSDLRPRL